MTKPPNNYCRLGTAEPDVSTGKYPLASRGKTLARAERVHSMGSQHLTSTVKKAYQTIMTAEYRYLISRTKPHKDITPVLLGYFPEKVIIETCVFFWPNMSPFKNVLLVGASGRVGIAMQAELLARTNSFSKLGVLTASTSASAPDPAKDAYRASLAAQGVGS